MFYLSAPYPSLQTTSVLPNPQFGDAESLCVTVTRKLSMNGKRRTYIKRHDSRRKLQWSFRLTRYKALELRAFLTSYFAAQIKVVDHNGRVWLGCFTSNPFEFDWPDRYTQTIQLEFEGVEQL
jgi:hypothetical protein